MDIDDDGDGILTQDELLDQNGGILDQDQDTVPDYLEPNNLNTDGDTDNNGDPLFNHLDSDDDGDTLPTADEVGNPLTPIDEDSDNIPDYLDVDTSNAAQTLDGSGDSDQDGLSDLFECATLPCPDTDNDAIPNYMDSDDDNDGTNTIDEQGDTDGDTVPDYLESNVNDTDGDGIPDVMDTDDDGNGIDTALEVGSNPFTPIDFNDNGIPDYLENGSPSAPDTDSDGLTDAFECPRQPCVDTDGDGLPNFNDPDDDNDGLNTANELPPLDSDGDGLPDYLESSVVDTDQDGQANQFDNDDENDGIPTADEIGPDSLYPLDQDNDQIPDYLDADSTNAADTLDGSGDSDLDGLSDIQECSNNPCEDTNGNGLPDYLDATDRNLGNGNGNVPERSILTNTDQLGGSMGLFFGLGLALMLASRRQWPHQKAPIGGETSPQMPNNTDQLTGNASNMSKSGSLPLKAPIAGLVAALSCSAAVGEIWQLENINKPKAEKNASAQSAAAANQTTPEQSDTKSKRKSMLDGKRFYVGGAIGVSRLEPETEGTGYDVSDKNDAGIKILGGIQATERLLLEASYSDLGASEVTSATQVADIDYRVFSFDALYKLPEFLPENFSAFGILGLTGLDTKSDAPEEEENTVQIKAGVAVEYAMREDWAVRSTLEKFSGDAAFLSAGLIKYFGGEKDSTPIVAAAPTPAPVPAPVRSLPPTADSDNDGVPDHLDACPDTLPGLSVDERGCGIFNRSFSNINFELNSTKLTTDSRTVLDDLALELKKVPHLTVEVQAHTDNIGTATYNVWLSNKRAEAIMEYLIVEHNIPAARLQPRGYGETHPIASNDDEYGRSQNRRAEFRIISNP
jgi:outer membrane protein OmpA-like peptidoglycan-associated protein